MKTPHFPKMYFSHSPSMGCVEDKLEAMTFRPLWGISVLLIL